PRSARSRCGRGGSRPCRRRGSSRAGELWMARATLIGFSAVAMWALLALLTDASGRTPPFLLSAITFAIGTAVGLVAQLFMPTSHRPAKIPFQVWVIGIGGLF